MVWLDGKQFAMSNPKLRESSYFLPHRLYMTMTSTGYYFYKQIAPTEWLQQQYSALEKKEEKKGKLLHEKS